MGYQFRGFLTSDPAVAIAATQRWPFCEAKHELEQGSVLIVRCPNESDLHPTEGEDAWERVLSQIAEVRSGLRDLSLQFPASIIVFIEVTCFGGTCTHEGLHVLGGRVVATFESGPKEVGLAEILRPLNVRLGDGQFFKPFTRGYFERDRPHAQHQPSSVRHENPVAPATDEAHIAGRPWWQFWRR